MLYIPSFLAKRCCTRQPVSPGGVEGAYRASCHGLEYPFFTFLQALLRVQELADPDRYFITVGNRNGVTAMVRPGITVSA